MRNLFSRLTFFLALIPLVAAVATFADALPDPAAVADSERKFAAAGLERGIRESFLQFFADDSIVFGPEPTNGKAFYEKYTDKGRALVWRPIFATIAKSGNFGFTTGPWQLKNSKADTNAIAYGDFVSVWKKQTDGFWKVALDVGVDHPQPTESPQLQLAPPTGVSGNEVSLQKKEEALFNALKTNGAAALLEAGTNDIRILRDDSVPAVGRDAAKNLLNANAEKTTRKHLGGGMSESHDLAYRYGSYSVDSDNASVAGYYLTYWQTDPSGDWKVLLDLQKKAPPEKK